MIFDPTIDSLRALIGSIIVLALSLVALTLTLAARRNPDMKHFATVIGCVLLAMIPLGIASQFDSAQNFARAVVNWLLP